MIKKKYCRWIITILRKKTRYRCDPLPDPDNQVAMMTIADFSTNDNDSPTDIMMKDITKEEQTLKCHKSLPLNNLMICALQCNPQFKSLFDQLGYGSKAGITNTITNTKALIEVSAQYRPKDYII